MCFVCSQPNLDEFAHSFFFCTTMWMGCILKRLIAWLRLNTINHPFPPCLSGYHPAAYVVTLLNKLRHGIKAHAGEEEMGEGVVL